MIMQANKQAREMDRKTDRQIERLKDRPTNMVKQMYVFVYKDTKVLCDENVCLYLHIRT